jgi:hypothetical protein
VPVLKPTIQSEDQEQMLFVQWFRRQYPTVRIFAIPNGGKRNIVTATRLKATGATAGVPDLYIPKWNVWVEMKRQTGGVLSPAQKDWIAYLTSIDHKVIVGKGWQDAMQKILTIKEPK